MKIDKVKLIFWIETVTDNGIETISKEEIYPIEYIIALGSKLQTALITQTIASLGEYVIQEGVTVEVLSSEQELFLEEDMFEPRLKPIYYQYG